MDYSKFKEQAKAALEGRWGLAIGTYLVVILLTVPLQAIPKIGWLFGILLSPLSIGYARFSLNMAQNLDPKLEDIFSGFKQYGRSVGAMFLMGLYIVLWMLLLVIPGIMAAYSYAMVVFILAEDDSIGVEETLNKSKKMMDGYRMDLFLLHLSFIGWALLCILTLGIGFFWLAPWVQVSTANFYMEVKTNWEVRGNVFMPNDAPTVS